MTDVPRSFFHVCLCVCARACVLRYGHKVAAKSLSQLEAAATANFVPEVLKVETVNDVKKDPRTYVITDPICLEHLTCPPIKREHEEPPCENVRRLLVSTMFVLVLALPITKSVCVFNPLKVLLDYKYGILRSSQFANKLFWAETAPVAPIADVLRWVITR